MEEQNANPTTVAPVVDIEQQKIERENKLKGFWKKPTIFIPIIILLIILGTYIRMLPLQERNGHPGLWDVTTNDYTLGPDLDPFLFLRYAKELAEDGHNDEIDKMRYVPLGYNTKEETVLLPQLIYYTKIAISSILNTLDSNNPNYEKYKSITFAAIMLPVIFFAFTIIAFFLFIYSIFSGQGDEPNVNRKRMFSGIIASISTFFMIIVPSFLARTVAGIPEKESVGFFFLFLSLWLFVLTLKNKKFIKVFTLGLLAGLSTALMALSWGGVVFVYVTIAASCLIGLIINKIHLEQKIGYIAWFSSSLIIIQMFTTRFKLMGFLTSLDTGLAALVFGIISFSLLIDQLKKRNIEKYIGLTWLKEKTKLPENIIIILMALVFILILASIIIGPSFILNKILDINRIMFNPSSGGRWVTTVAENAQPYFTQWYGSFGQFGFWIFILGSGLFFWNMLSAVFQKKEKIILTLLYGFMVAGIIFSRYAPSSILNGTNFISKAFYLISAISFVAGIIYYYLLGEKTGRKMFDKIDKSWLILFVLLILSLFTARSAIRLIMVISIIGPIFISYIITQLAFSAIYGDKNKKIAYWLTFTVIIIFMVISCNAYYGSITSQSYNYVPYFYTNQWQEAMSWVRTATPTTAVFAQWWDYGYWIQSIGERATMTDGGNSIVYWNYLTGRYVLTGENQKESLEVLYAHNVSYLLIDSSDIGKYGAFSQIGSDINFDRLSSGPLTMMSDPKNTVETRNGYTRIYQGSSYLDEDIKFNNTYMFKENSAILGVELRIDNETIQQPIGIFYNAGQNIRVPLRYLYYNGNMTDFNNGVDAAVYPIQNINLQANNQLSIDTLGGMLYLSPRVLRGYLGQVYILNDPFNNFPNFKLAHTEPDYILKLIMQQNGMVLGDFVLYQGLRGPIKIWDVTYTPDIKLISKYQDKVFPPEINWTF